MKKYLFIALALVCMGWGVMETPLPPKKASKTWRWHADGGFRYPSSYLRSEVFVDDVPASVEVFSKGSIRLCYWSLLGTWSTLGDFPEEGVWLSPKKKEKNVTYRAYSKGIKQKMIPGGEVQHSKVLVLIHPKSMKNKVSSLVNVVKDW